MNQSNDRALEGWLAALFTETPDLSAAVQAAAATSSIPRDTPALRQLLEALGGDMEDQLDCERCQVQLPDFLHAQQQPSAAAPSFATDFADLRTHLALCPYCTAAYVQVAAWLVAAETETTPVAAAYPTFDLAFLNDTSAVAVTPSLTVQLRTQLATARAAGRQWLDDTRNGIYILLGPGLQTQTASGWAVKSATPGALLAQTILAEDEVPGWEIEVSLFADEENGEQGQIEVALYPYADPDRALAGHTVTLHGDTLHGDTLHGDEPARTTETDGGGVAHFTAIPLAALDTVIVHVAVKQ